MLTLSGPADRIPEAKAMATALILRSQEHRQQAGPFLPQRIETHVNGNTLQLPEHMPSVSPHVQPPNPTMSWPLWLMLQAAMMDNGPPPHVPMAWLTHFMHAELNSQGKARTRRARAHAAETEEDEAEEEAVQYGSQTETNEGEPEGEPRYGTPSPQFVYISPAREPTGLHIKIQCLGLVTLQDWGVHHWEPITTETEDKIKTAFPKQYPRDPTPSMCVSCKQFHTPPCPGWHCGEHSDFVRNLVEHGEFHPWLKSFKEKFLQAHTDALAKRQDELVIALACKAGVNRSVGMCSIVAHILEQQGHKVTKIWLSKHIMRQREICTDCAFCRDGYSAVYKKFRALEAAAAMYRQIAC